MDVHSRLYVVAVQHGHGAIKPARRFEPHAFVLWVETLLRAGHEVHVIYEACGFGFGLCRALEKAGAKCVVIAPRKLDERRTSSLILHAAMRDCGGEQCECDEEHRALRSAVISIGGAF